MADEERKPDEDNYELPPGVILPQDTSSDYPDWKKGIVAGIPSGIMCGIVLAFTPLSKEIIGKVGFGIFGFAMGFLMVGCIVAFRPPKN